MRPMTDQADYVTGAFTPRAWRITRENALRQSSVPLVASQALGVVPVQGAFQDVSTVRYGTARFLNPYTVPVAEFPIPAIMPQYADQVQNPYTVNQNPGYTTDLPVSLADRVSQMLNKNYTGNVG